MPFELFLLTAASIRLPPGKKLGKNIHPLLWLIITCAWKA